MAHTPLRGENCAILFLSRRLLRQEPTEIPFHFHDFVHPPALFHINCLAHQRPDRPGEICRLPDWCQSRAAWSPSNLLLEPASTRTLYPRFSFLLRRWYRIG